MLLSTKLRIEIYSFMINCDLMAYTIPKLLGFRRKKNMTQIINLIY
jgi:hypothetical protein